MVGPLGVLSMGLIVVTTEVVEDIDGGCLGGAVGGSGSGHHQICKETSMVGPQGSVTGGFGSGHHFQRKVSMVGPLEDAVGRTSSNHHCLAIVVGVDVVDGRPPRRQYRSRERPPPNVVGYRWCNQAPSRDLNSISYPKGH
jgi:hypothetical protein